MKYLRILISAATLLLASCIENDLPYPVVTLNILGVEGEGFTVSDIDGVQRVVTLALDEKTDIRNVQIDKVTLTDQAVASRELTGTFDMRTPIYVTLTLYQDYAWTIRADQQIDRKFAVSGQVGATEFDIDNRSATAYVPKGTDLSAVTVTDLKLGPADITTYSPTLEELSGSSFESVRFVDATCHGRTERWMLNVEPSSHTVRFTVAEAWSQVIWLEASGIEGQTLGFRYRKQGTEAWIEVPDVKVSGGSFSTGLKADPTTSYEVTAYCNDEETDVKVLTTEGVMQLPNGDMESWTEPKVNGNGSSWLPYLLDGSGNPVDRYWDSGNKGATTLGEKYNLTTPVTDLHPGAKGKYAAQLASRYVAIKFAAGNLFVGQYARTIGTNGIVNFGQPFTLRPTGVRLWVKFTCGRITDIGKVPVGTNLKEGDPDNGSIYIAMGTWTKEKYGRGKDNELFGTDSSPVSIDTRELSSFFNPKGEDVIGYGERILTEDIGEWTQITIPIVYRSKTERPTHLIFVCSASRWGDYFTGSRNSLMTIDDVELLYEPLDE